MIPRGSGFTLVELLISLALGSVLMLASSTLLGFGVRALAHDRDLARQQENARYALRLLTREIELSGFYAGSSVAPVESPGMQAGPCTSYLLSFQEPLEVLADQQASTLPADCLPRADRLEGTAVIVLRRTMDRPLPLGVWAPDALYLASGAVTPRLVFGASAIEQGLEEIWRYQPTVFFIRDYSANRGDALPALCRKRMSPNRLGMAPAECLVEGIVALQLELGRDGEQGLPMGAARLSLSARSPENDSHGLMTLSAFVPLRNRRPVAGSL